MKRRAEKRVSFSRIEIVIFVAALVLRLVFMAAMITDLGSNHLTDKYPDPIKYIRAGDYMFGGDAEGKIDLYLVGPGYPFLLGLAKLIIGPIYWPIILLQIILSAISCVLVFRLAKILLDNKYIAVVSGLLLAISMTSITLANAIASETLFFFLMVLTLYLFFKYLPEKRWWPVILVGVIGGLTVLTRSVFMFYPVLLIIFALIFIGFMHIAEKKRMVLNAIVCAAIIVAISASWGLRNYEKHDTFTISATGLLAAKTYLTSKVFVEGERQKPERTVVIRDSVFQAALHDFENNRYRENRQESIDYIYITFKRFPGLFIKQYFRIVLYNVTAISSLQNILVPSWKKTFNAFDEYVHRGYDDPAYIAFALIGFAVLWRKNRGVAAILLLNVFYFAFLSGVTFGQGSRIFYPALATESILVGTSLIFFYDIIILTAVKFGKALKRN